MNMSGILGRPAVVGVAGMQMQDRRAGFGRRDPGFGDLVGGHRQMRRHRRGVDRPGDRTGDDDLASGLGCCHCEILLC
jgi:hypothetical protein